MLEVVEDLAQLHIGIVVQGIHHLGTIDRDVGNMLFLLVDHVLIIHQGVFPFFLTYFNGMSLLQQCAEVLSQTEHLLCLLFEKRQAQSF